MSQSKPKSNKSLTCDSRRQFLRHAALIAVSAPFIPALGGLLANKEGLAQAAEVALPEGQSAVLETDPVASAIGYKQNAKDIDFKKYPQKKLPAAKNQFCHNCALYTPVNQGWGKCQMLTSGLVTEHGWCGSWNKKA